LTVLSPKQEVKQFHLEVVNNPQLSPDFQLYYDENKITKIRKYLVKETISYYQTASEILRKKAYQSQ
jgi:hypothetical protein